MLSSLKLLYRSSCLPIRSFNRIKILILNSPNLYLRFIYAWISPSANSVFIMNNICLITMYNITSIDLRWQISTTDKLLLRNVHFDELADLFFRVFVWVLLMFHPTSTGFSLSNDRRWQLLRNGREKLGRSSALLSFVLFPYDCHIENGQSAPLD